MELADVLARRRMVRRYDPDVPVDPEALEAVLAAALRAPSAGFTQGVSLLVLDDPRGARPLLVHHRPFAGGDRTAGSTACGPPRCSCSC